MNARNACRSCRKVTRLLTHTSLVDREAESLPLHVQALEPSRPARMVPMPLKEPLCLTCAADPSVTAGLLA